MNDGTYRAVYTGTKKELAAYWRGMAAELRKDEANYTPRSVHRRIKAERAHVYETCADMLEALQEPTP